MHPDAQSESARLQLEPILDDANVDESGSIDLLLGLAIAANASDIILVNGSPVTFRVNGALAAVPGPDITAEDISSLFGPLLTPARREELTGRKCLDFCFFRGSTARFRANLHFQRGTLAASIRLLPSEVPTLESLNLPPSLSV